jgi:hypothetical protein
MAAWMGTARAEKSVAEKAALTVVLSAVSKAAWRADL